MSDVKDVKSSSSATNENTHALPWVEKHRPKVLKDVVGHEETLKRLRLIAKQGNFFFRVFVKLKPRFCFIKQQQATYPICYCRVRRAPERRPPFYVWHTNYSVTIFTKTPSWN
jgi:hypothetical protein